MPRQLTLKYLAAGMLAMSGIVGAAQADRGTATIARRGGPCPLPHHRVLASNRSAVVFLSPAHPPKAPLQNQGEVPPLFLEGCLRPHGRPLRLTSGAPPLPAPALALTERYAAVNIFSQDLAYNVGTLAIFDLKRRRKVFETGGFTDPVAKVVLASDGSYALVQCTNDPPMGVFPMGPCRDSTLDQMTENIEVGARQSNGHYVVSELTPPSDNHATLAIHGQTVGWTYRGVQYHAVI